MLETEKTSSLPNYIIRIANGKMRFKRIISNITAYTDYVLFD
jgi:hypothetical protein